MLEAVNKNEVQSGPTNTGADGNRKTENRKQTLPSIVETFQKTKVWRPHFPAFIVTKAPCKIDCVHRCLSQYIIVSVKFSTSIECTKIILG